MFYYLHYILTTSGLSGTSVLLAIYFRNYTDASQSEIGALLLAFPLADVVVKPWVCSLADRHQAHKLCLFLLTLVELIGYAPFALVPFFPQFYTHHPRAAWYVLAAACVVGNASLGVAWTLGDCLAFNKSLKSGTPFGHFRMVGTLSWGVYGFIIGQINETPLLPKYVPAFMILHASLIIELLLIYFWNDDDFILVDPMQQMAASQATTNTPPSGQHAKVDGQPGASVADSYLQLSGYLSGGARGSVAGTLKMNAKSASALREMLSSASTCEPELAGTTFTTSPTRSTGSGGSNGEMGAASRKPSKKKAQMVLLKMIFAKDGRALKYIFLFTAFGLFMSPMNFLFMSLEELCHERHFNFSQLAGWVLVAQALIETLSFFTAPLVLSLFTKSTTMSLSISLMLARFLFYAFFYYTAQISPYWALLGELGHGYSYGLVSSIHAEVAMMFANESRVFIGDLRRMGYLSAAAPKDGESKEEIAAAEAIREQEEHAIRLALRATMQALFSAFLDGFGQGLGALLCGCFIQLYSYVGLWKLMALLAGASLLLQQLIEVTRSRWSDSYRPLFGSRAYQIRQLDGDGSCFAAKRTQVA